MTPKLAIAPDGEFAKTLNQGTLEVPQATAFPSHIILYKEDRTYKSGKVIRPG
jgi:hypothetical protein